MNLSRALLTTLATLMLFAVSIPAFAQEQDQADRMKNPPASVTGCLVKSDMGDQWVLVDAVSGGKLVLTGSDLDKHANHMIKVTGAPSEDGKSFNVAKIEHIADSCQPK